MAVGFLCASFQRLAGGLAAFFNGGEGHDVAEWGAA
jgi:hypothetical protein